MKIQHRSPAAKARITTSRDSRVSNGFKYSVKGVEYEFQTGLIDRTNVTGRAGKITAKIALAQSVPDFEWRAGSNDMVPFTASEFLEMAIAMDEFVEIQYKTGWSL